MSETVGVRLSWCDEMRSEVYGDYTTMMQQCRALLRTISSEIESKDVMGLWVDEGGNGRNDDDALVDATESTVRFFFFSSRRRHTRFDCDWSSDVCSSD